MKIFFKVIFSPLIIRIIENRILSGKGIHLWFNIKYDTLSPLSTFSNETTLHLKLPCLIYLIANK